MNEDWDTSNRRSNVVDYTGNRQSTNSEQTDLHSNRNGSKGSNTRRDGNEDVDTNNSTSYSKLGCRNNSRSLNVFGPFIHRLESMNRTEKNNTTLI